MHSVFLPQHWWPSIRYSSYNIYLGYWVSYWQLSDCKSGLLGLHTVGIVNWIVLHCGAVQNMVEHLPVALGFSLLDVNNTQLRCDNTQCFQTMTDASPAPKPVPVESHCSKPGILSSAWTFSRYFLIVLFEPSSLLATDNVALNNMSSCIQDVYILMGRETEAKETH